MAYSREDFLELKARQRLEIPERSQFSEADHVAAVASRLLTQDSKWNTYLERLQARVEREQEHAMACQVRLMSPLLVNHEEIMQLKVQHAGHLAGAGALEWAMQLPVEIAGADSQDEEASEGDS